MRYFFTLLILMVFPASFAIADASVNPCIEADKQGVRLRSPTNPLDWKCMRYQAENGDTFQQFYVGLALVQGNSPEGKKIPEAISLLTTAAQKGQDGAIATLARLYYAGDKDMKPDIERAYQWAFLAKHPVKENMIIRGDHEKEDREKIEQTPTIMEKIEAQISTKHAKELKLDAPHLLK